MRTIRLLNAYLLAPVLALTGTGFSRTHRQNNDLVYRLIDTVAANQIAAAINPMRGGRQ